MRRRLSDLARGAVTYGADVLASGNGTLRAALLLNEYRGPP